MCYVVILLSQCNFRLIDNVNTKVLVSLVIEVLGPIMEL